MCVYNVNKPTNNQSGISSGVWCRLRHLMGYRKEDLKDKLVFDFHHHDDTEATLECSKGSKYNIVYEIRIVYLHTS